jgi:hypothetical protein
VSEITGISFDYGWYTDWRGAFSAYQSSTTTATKRMDDTTEIFETVTIPATVTRIGSGAFMGRGIKKSSSQKTLPILENTLSPSMR